MDVFTENIRKSLNNKSERIPAGYCNTAGLRLSQTCTFSEVFSKQFDKIFRTESFQLF